jgi:hypothetical protein
MVPKGGSVRTLEVTPAPPAVTATTRDQGSGVSADHGGGSIGGRISSQRDAGLFDTELASLGRTGSAAVSAVLDHVMIVGTSVQLKVDDPSGRCNHPRRRRLLAMGVDHYEPKSSPNGAVNHPGERMAEPHVPRLLSAVCSAAVVARRRLTSALCLLISGPHLGAGHGAWGHPWLLVTAARRSGADTALSSVDLPHWRSP